LFIAENNYSYGVKILRTEKSLRGDALAVNATGRAGLALPGSDTEIVLSKGRYVTDAAGNVTAVTS
jgi:hypothetical protein